MAANTEDEKVDYKKKIRDLKSEYSRNEAIVGVARVDDYS